MTYGEELDKIAEACGGSCDDSKLYGDKLDKIAQLISEMPGGGGGDGVSITDVAINQDGDLIVTLSNNTTIDAGYCKGDTGATGADGTNGTDGENGISPTIEVYANTTSNYQLKINNADGTHIITPNLLGTGATTTKYYVFDNAMYTNYVDTIYTIFNNALKSVSEYIAQSQEFCSATTNHALYYNTNDFGWDGLVVTISTVAMEIEPTQMLLYGYMSQASKTNEYFKFIPSSLVTGSTALEKATSIQALLAAGNENIITVPFDYVCATNGITEAVNLSDVASGEYYIAWSAHSDNSRPKVNDITIV